MFIFMQWAGFVVDVIRVALRLTSVLLCAARGANPAADQAPPPAGGAQQPAGTHSSSADGPGSGGAQRQGQH